MRILVAESDPYVGGFLVAGLQDEGHAVTAVSDGVRAQQLLEGGQYDVVILDLPPGSRSRRFLSTLVDRGPAIAILRLTTPEDRDASIVGLTSDALCKPFRFGDLLAKLTNLAATAPNQSLRNQPCGNPTPASGPEGPVVSAVELDTK